MTSALHHKSYQQGLLIKKQLNFINALEYFDSLSKALEFNEPLFFECKKEIIELYFILGQLQEIEKELLSWNHLPLNNQQKCYQAVYWSRLYDQKGYDRERNQWAHSAYEKWEQEKWEDPPLEIKCLLARGEVKVESGAYFKKARAILKPAATQRWEEYLACLCAIGLTFRGFGGEGFDLAEVTQEIEEALEKLDQQLKHPDYWQAKLSYVKGFLLFGLKNEEALADFLESEALFKKVFGEKVYQVIELSEVYFGVSQVYYFMGDYQEALIQANKASNVARINNSFLSIETLGWISFLFTLMGNMGSAIKYSEKYVEVYKNKNPDWENAVESIMIYFSQGVCYQKNDEEKAAENYLKALKLLRKNKVPETNRRYEIFWFKLAQLDYDNRGLEYLEKIWAFKLGKTDREAAFLIAGDCYQNRQKWDKALEHYKKALQLLMRNEQVDFNDDNLLAYTNHYPRFWKALVKVGDVYFLKYEEEKEAPLLQEALNFYQKSFKVLEAIRQTYTDYSRLLINDGLANAYAFFIKAILLNENLQEEGAELENHKMNENSAIEQILAIFEKCKGNVLLQNLMHDRARKILQKTPAYEKEKQLKEEMDALEQTLLNKVPEERATLFEKFYEKRREYQELIAQLENDFPDYYELKYQNKTSSLSAIQNQLKENQILINYFVTETEIFLLYIEKEEQEVVIIQRPKQLNKEIQALVVAIKTQNDQVYKEQATRLYECLVLPVGDLLFGLFGRKRKYADLIIIPHNQLNHIPFETLIASQENNQVKYLLDDFNISYHYSASLWMQGNAPSRGRKEKEPSKKELDFLGLAPIYSSQYEQGLMDDAGNTRGEGVDKGVYRKNWEELPYSKEEVTSIAAMFENRGEKSKVFLNEQASKKNFLENASQVRILHLAAHFHHHEIPQLSGLVFGDNTKLFVDEAFGLQLKAELVVMSACESGVGALANSEGLMAINRGLLFAGAQNVVSTLFEINDYVTKLLMEAFYEGIISGLSIREALGNAKRKLIKNKQIPVKFWSAFILFGK